MREGQRAKLARSTIQSRSNGDDDDNDKNDDKDDDVEKCPHPPTIYLGGLPTTSQLVNHKLHTLPLLSMMMITMAMVMMVMNPNLLIKNCTICHFP